MGRIVRHRLGRTPVALQDGYQGRIGGGSTLVQRPLVLAHYYLWYSPDTDLGIYHRGQWGLCDEPDKLPLGHPWAPLIGVQQGIPAGEYHSNNTDVIADHIRQFKAMGLDGITLSYWGYDQGFSLDARLQKIANALEAEGLLFLAFYEAASFVSQQAQDWMLYIYTNLVINPATGLFRSNYIWKRGYLTGDAKPVILIQDRCVDETGSANYVNGDYTDKSFANTAYFRALRDTVLISQGTGPGGYEPTGFYTISPDVGSVAGTQMALDSFDGAFIYNPVFISGAQWVQKLGVMNTLAAAYPNFGVFTTVLPGYNDSGENVDSDWDPLTLTGNELSRNNGATYIAYWNTQQTYCPLASTVLITSFNEHGEGSGIEEQTEDFPQTVVEAVNQCFISGDPPWTYGDISWTMGFGTEYTGRTATQIAAWKAHKATQGAFPPLVPPGGP